MITLNRLVHDLVGGTCLVNTYILLLEKTYSSDEKLLDYLSKMKARVKEMNELIDQFYIDHKDNETLKFKKET